MNKYIVGFLFSATATSWMFPSSRLSNNTMHRKPAYTTLERHENIKFLKEMFTKAEDEHKRTGEDLSSILLSSVQKLTPERQDFAWRSTIFVGDLFNSFYLEGPHNNQRMIDLMDELHIWETTAPNQPNISLGDVLAYKNPDLTIHLKTLGFDVTRINRSTFDWLKKTPRFADGRFAEIFSEAFQDPRQKSPMNIAAETYELGPKPESAGLCEREIRSYAPVRKAFRECHRFLCSSPIETTNFCQFAFDLGETKFPDSVAKSEKTLKGLQHFREKLGLRNCRFLLKLKVRDGFALVKPIQSDSDRPVSTVTVTPKLISINKDGVLQRTPEDNLSEEVGYEVFVEFATNYCRDKVIVRTTKVDAQSVSEKHYFNDYRGTLRETLRSPIMQNTIFEETFIER